MKEKLLTTREVSQILGITEKEIIDLANANKIPHFKVANEFLRFKKEDILRIKKDIQKKFNVHRDKISWGEKIREFLYFNDFYIISALIILILLYIILKD
ncbi:MAG: helix-turn-helix domain-containing protein [Candidatus Omnitrophica bacterium]|nr:helix-turn-helix domain-containing protein [Candidatus Omnitrophota bacterium]MCM8826937.1 helix-turn-helix domain-containing protein [Candidatus Omnitrophota bacterium]